jgi:hypothetical protein
MTLDDLKAKGWVFQNHGSCSRCFKDVEWWLSRNGNPAPFDPMSRGTDEAVFHGETCDAK